MKSFVLFASKPEANLVLSFLLYIMIFFSSAIFFENNSEVFIYLVCVIITIKPNLIEHEEWMAVFWLTLILHHFEVMPPIDQSADSF